MHCQAHGAPSQWLLDGDFGLVQEAEEEADGEDASVQFQKYCDAMAGPAVWGGQAELSALAHVVRRSIQVFSVGMPPVTMGEEYAGVTLPRCRRASTPTSYPFAKLWPPSKTF